MRSSRPAAETRMPVRIGRVSSRDAERATRATVSTNAAAGTSTTASPAGLGQRREVLAAQRPDVEGGGAGLDLDVLVGRPQLERDLRGRKRADDVERQARRHDRRARPHDRRLERDPQAHLHVGGASSTPSSWTEIWTPESAWTALRVEATRETVCSCARRSALVQVIFTMNASRSDSGS